MHRSLVCKTCGPDDPPPTAAGGRNLARLVRAWSEQTQQDIGSSGMQKQLGLPGRWRLGRLPKALIECVSEKYASLKFQLQKGALETLE